MRKVASFSKTTPRRLRGIAIVYVVLVMPVLIGCAAFAVDFGYLELNQLQLQGIADSCSHDYMVLYTKNSNSTSLADAQISTTKNKAFTLNGTSPTVAHTWGYWNPATHAFSTSNSSGAAPAVQVTVTYTGIPLMFASIIGPKSITLHATSTAASLATTIPVTIASTSNPYLAGMPSTAVSYFGDTGTTNAAVQPSIPVVPGSYITFSTFTGTSSVLPGYMPYYGPNGSTGTYGTATEHGQNWDGPYLGPGTENGIADAIMPESSLMGIFLDNSQPDSTSAPTSTVDWTQASVRDNNTFTNLGLKQPFFIGDGTNGAVVKQFQVPAGATRLFLGTWDGVQWDNNGGSISGNITVKNSVVVVQ